MNRNWLYFIGFELMCLAYITYIQKGLRCVPCIPNKPCAHCTTDDVVFVAYMAVAVLLFFLSWQLLKKFS